MHAAMTATDTSLLNLVVRMVVPMRREFGSTLDVQQFLRDTAYARSVVDQARGSQEERLRGYADLVDRMLRGGLPARAAAARPAPASPDLVARRNSASRALLDQVGPLGEALAIRIERAVDTSSLDALLVIAEQTIANVRGRAAAEAYAGRFAVGS